MGFYPGLHPHSAPPMDQTQAEKIIHHWLNGLTYSAATRDLEGHMELISRRVQVYGVLKEGAIDFDGWYKRRAYEFGNNLLDSLSYRNIDIISIAQREIIFTVLERMKATNGASIQVEKEVCLAHESDDVWRVSMETILRITLHSEKFHLTP